MSRYRRFGFSFLEVMAAIVILAVVAAATVATVAPMRAQSENKIAEKEIATLNALAHSFYLDRGHYPQDVAAIVRGGYLEGPTDEGRARMNQLLRKYHYSPAAGRFTRKSHRARVAENP